MLEVLLRARLNCFFFYTKEREERGRKFRRKERGELMELMDERVEGWPGMEENERVAIAMVKHAQIQQYIGRSVERLWRKKLIYVANGSHPSTRS